MNSIVRFNTFLSLLYKQVFLFIFFQIFHYWIYIKSLDFFKHSNNSKALMFINVYNI